MRPTRIDALDFGQDMSKPLSPEWPRSPTQQGNSYDRGFGQDMLAERNTSLVADREGVDGHASRTTPHAS